MAQQSAAVSNRIYVAGLDGKVNAADLRAYFGKFGPLTDVYIPNNHQTGQPKHFGFVTFGNHDAATEAMNAPSHEINGQQVDLKPCVPKQDFGKGGGKADAAIVGGLAAAGNAIGLGVNLPMQPGMQPAMPAFGGLGLQAMQQQMLLQQQMQQQQLMQQFLAKMQQSQQVAPVQPDAMFAPLGGCGGLPTSSADQATGSTLPTPGTSPVPSSMCMPTLGQPAFMPFAAGTEMQLGVPTPGIQNPGLPTPMANLGTMSTQLVDQTSPSPLLQGLPPQQVAGNSLAIDQNPAAFGQAPSIQQLTPVAPVQPQSLPAVQPASGQIGEEASGQPLVGGVQPPALAGSPPGSMTSPGVGMSQPAFGGVPSMQVGQGAARYAPY